MFCRATLMLVLALIPVAANAGTYYVAADGKPENDGSVESPWPSVGHALSKVGGGHTIVLKPGVYRGPILIPKQCAGTEAQPTVIKAEIKWKAVILGAEFHVVYTGGGCDWVIIDGLEVMGARYDGVKISGNHSVVRNCWVHNNMAMGIAMHNCQGGTIERNLVEFNGDHVQFDHGVYADGDGLTVRGNVVRHNASYGLHLYPAIKNSRIENNLVFGQVARRGIIVASPRGGGNNTIVNNTVVERQPLTLWHGKGEVVANNILVAEGPEAILFNEDTQDVLADYNLCLPKSPRQGPHGLSGDPRFVDAPRGVFWLGKGSPAIGKGTREHAPPTDFWARPTPQDKPPDLGAFAYEPTLAREEVRAGWDYGWTYHRHGSKAGLPDPWSLPPSPPAEDAR